MEAIEADLPEFSKKDSPRERKKKKIEYARKNQKHQSSNERVIMKEKVSTLREMPKKQQVEEEQKN